MHFLIFDLKFHGGIFSKIFSKNLWQFPQILTLNSVFYTPLMDSKKHTNKTSPEAKFRGRGVEVFEGIFNISIFFQTVDTSCFHRTKLGFAQKIKST
jgi:hypothetical protein